MNKRLHRRYSVAWDYIEPLIRSYMMKERGPRLSNALQAVARVLAMGMIQFKDTRLQIVLVRTSLSNFAQLKSLDWQPETRRS